jgi:hypothetical protein
MADSATDHVLCAISLFAIAEIRGFGLDVKRPENLYGDTRHAQFTTANAE